jgi:hypothetical protein
VSARPAAPPLADGAGTVVTAGSEPPAGETVVFAGEGGRDRDSRCMADLKACKQIAKAGAFGGRGIVTTVEAI